MALPVGADTTVALTMTSDVPVAAVGGAIAISVEMDVGPNLARDVWLNITVTSPLEYVTDTADGIPQFDARSVAGSVLQFSFSNLPPKLHAFALGLVVGSGTVEQDPMEIAAAIDYTNNAGIAKPQVLGQVSVGLAQPDLQASFIPSATPVDPGSSFFYGVQVTNVGADHARDVWMNVTLPPEVTWTMNAPAATCGGLSCMFNNVPKNGGSKQYEVHVSVGSSVPRGTTFTATLHVDASDPSGTPIVGFEVEATVTVRALTELLVDKTVDATIATPESDVTFTIWYNNTQSSPLGLVWINDTLPTGLTYNASTPIGTHSSGVIRWSFPSIAPGPHFVRVRATVDATVSNSTVLRNAVRVEYLDPVGVPAAPVTATAIVTVDASAPSFRLTKTASSNTAKVGDTVVFTLRFENVGDEAAESVVIQDLIPPGTKLTEPSEAHAPSSGRLFVWTFSDVPPGSRELTYKLFLESPTPGLQIVNNASLNAVAYGGRNLSPRATSVGVYVDAVEGGSPVLIVLLGLAIAVAGGGAAFAVYARRSRPVIDELFLLHRDGLLIKHYTRRIRPDVDSDVLSGMLIAVQNFVNESFLGANGLAKEGKLDELRFGSFKIVIERGKTVIIAAILSSDPTDRVKNSLRATIAGIDREFGEKLSTWEGDMRSVEGVDKYMQALISGRPTR